LRSDICPESVGDDGNEDEDTEGCEDKIVSKNQTVRLYLKLGSFCYFCQSIFGILVILLPKK